MSLAVGQPCHVQGKRKFRTRLDVLIDHMNNPRPIRAYKCPHCRHWHASSHNVRRPT